MKKLLSLFMMLLAFAVMAGDAPTYTCSLKVDTPKMSSKKQKDSGGGRNATETKSVVMTWPVKVSFNGKDFPKDVSIKAYFIGVRDKEATILGESTTAVPLNETNVFKTEIKSPAALLTTTNRQSGGGRNRRTVSETTGDRITGAILQLVSGGKVLKSWASKPGWAKLAKKDTLDTEAVLKIR